MPVQAENSLAANEYGCHGARLLLGSMSLHMAAFLFLSLLPCFCLFIFLSETAYKRRCSKAVQQKNESVSMKYNPLQITRCNSIWNERSFLEHATVNPCSCFLFSHLMHHRLEGLNWRFSCEQLALNTLNLHQNI